MAGYAWRRPPPRRRGLKGAIATVLYGASWQPYRTYDMRNLLTRVPEAAQSIVTTLVPSPI
jgi:transposase-like protein